MNSAPFSDDFLEEFRKLVRKVARIERSITRHEAVGEVAANGSILKGSRGYSVGHPSTGVYVVTFDEEFDTEPVVNTTAISSTDIAPWVFGGTITTDEFVVVTSVANTGVLTDSAFSFHVIQP